MRIIPSGLFPDPRIIYDLSPAEVQAACDGYEEQRRQTIEMHNVYVGSICAAIYNTTPRRGGSSKRALTWRDFFRPTAPKREVVEEQDMETMQQTAMRITRMLGGTIHGSNRN